MLKELIYKYFEDKRLQKESSFIIKDKITFAPSYLTKCQRQIYYDKTGMLASNPTETHAFIKFELGDRTHEALQDIFKKIGIWQDGEDFQEINYNELDFIFRYDGLLNINDYKYMIEIKSIYANGFMDIEKNGAKEDHILQLFCYMLWKKINRGIIIYIGRDNGHILEFNFSIEGLKERYQEKFNMLCEKLKKLKINIQNKILPDREFDISMKNLGNDISFDFQANSQKYKSDWHCNYCQYKDECWKNEIIKLESGYKFYIKGEFLK